MEGSREEIEPELNRAGSQNLREHMIGILFASGAVLGPLQRQVLSHVFQEITHAASGMRTAAMRHRSASGQAQQWAGDDNFAFALVNMLLALSGSQQGCSEISAKASLMANLCTLLQVGTERLQRYEQP